MNTVPSYNYGMSQSKVVDVRHDEELEALRVQTEHRDGWRRDVVLYQEQLLAVEDSDSLAEPYGLQIFENYLDH